MKIIDFYNFKKGNKISMITCYDYSMARILSKTDIDCLLVGDSLSMVVYGYDSTIYASVDVMAEHTKAVKKGIGNSKMIITDMPFLSTRKGMNYAIEVAEKIIKAGADAIKIENIEDQRDIISHIIKSGIPVMGHLGLTPQYIKSLGSYSKRGREIKESKKIIDDAIKFQEAGAFSIVLECIDEKTAGRITKKLKIPTIGIGSGNRTDGQVVVINDILGLYEHVPPFIKKYEELDIKIINAVNKYIKGVKSYENDK